jgi:hypothetical protein
MKQQPGNQDFHFYGIEEYIIINSLPSEFSVLYTVWVFCVFWVLRAKGIMHAYYGAVSN